MKSDFFWGGKTCFSQSWVKNRLFLVKWQFQDKEYSEGELSFLKKILGEQDHRNCSSAYIGAVSFDRTSTFDVQMKFESVMSSRKPSYY